MTTGRFLRAIHGGRRLAQGLARDEAGVSAIEFGLVAPMLFFSLLAMFDVGMALRERIQLDHILRSGAQTALRDAGKSAVLDTLRRTVCKTGEAYPDCAGLAQVSFAPEPDPYCICPTTGVKDTTCTATCPVRPQKYYELSAAMSHEGIFLPRFDFAPSVLVEVR
ncbi:TadE/TadG family type IV pilus assembly protein [Limimaricola soesokkakensis]|uniref:TadE/TadG family type IV pilus assembly protein n=1 Tax=Limimaricola soesokkakensis TaxID=1343159 RepID=UPI003511C41A